MSTVITLIDETYGDPEGDINVVTSVTVVDETNGTVTETESGSTTIELDVGVEGPRGAAGPQIQPIHFTLTAVSDYLAVHHFGWPPEAWFVRADGTPVTYGYRHQDSTHVYVQFPEPFTGKMYLR